MIPASEALAKLKTGNQRYTANATERSIPPDPDRRKKLALGQSPFAIILGCSDSRVPAEIVFDQGSGDLFVIRVAGNIVAPSLVGSVEFAAEQFDTRLVVVLGHSQCGAVKATLDALKNPGGVPSPNLASIVDRIKPALQDLPAVEPATDPEEYLAQAVRANVRRSVNDLRHGSAILEGLIANDGLLIVGAEYSLETGEVEFFDEPAQDD